MSNKHITKEGRAIREALGFPKAAKLYPYESLDQAKVKAFMQILSKLMKKYGADDWPPTVDEFWPPGFEDRTGGGDAKGYMAEGQDFYFSLDTFLRPRKRLSVLKAAAHIAALGKAIQSGMKQLPAVKSVGEPFLWEADCDQAEAEKIGIHVPTVIDPDWFLKEQK